MDKKPVSVWYFFPYEQWSRASFATIEEALASLSAIKSNVSGNRRMLKGGEIKVTIDVPIEYRNGAFVRKSDA